MATFKSMSPIHLVEPYFSCGAWTTHEFSARLCTHNTLSLFYLIIVEDRFFGPQGVTSLATHATSTYYWFFWVNLFKPQNKLISYSTIWIGLTWPTKSLLQEANSWSNFLFINWDHNPRYHQYQHMDWA